MNILDGIVEKDNTFGNIVAGLRNDGHKIYVYGNGLGGKRVRRYLVRHGIAFDGTIVDKRYWEEDSGSLCMEDIMERTNEPINLIIAFRGYSPKKLACYKEKINAVIDMDCWAGMDNADEEEWTYEWIRENAEEFQCLYDNLQDDLSCSTLLAYMNQKISFDYKYLKTVRQPFQYFDKEINKMSEHEVFVDCGAYDGDSVENFISALRRRGYESYDEIVSFEPNPENYKKLKARNFKNHTCIQKGVGSKRKTFCFSEEGTSSRCIESGELNIQVDSIDNVMKGRRVTMIKMDIEGAEFDALHGAKETIKEYKPLLAICMYHKREDLLKIPQYIKLLVPEYRLFLRAYEYTATELVLYAVADL